MERNKNQFEATQEFDDNTTCEKSETIYDSAEVEEVKSNA